MYRTHNRSTSDVSCHHRPWIAHTNERCRAWNSIIALEPYTWSDNIRGGMPSSPLDIIDGQTTLGVACHHRPWTENAVEQRWAWHAIMVFGQHTRSKDVGVACHHRLWAAPTTEQHRAWHDISAVGQHTRSDDIEGGMTSPPLDSSYG